MTPSDDGGPLPMKNLDRYVLESVFLVIVLLLSIAGFWNVYFGPDSSPTPYHHLHARTILVWLLLLLWQLTLVRRKQNRLHSKTGLSILIFGPLLIATTALLSVHSAHEGIVSGEGDFLVVQNVMVTLELGAIIVLAFVLRKRRKLHGALLLSTALLFMGIALFFTLISFVPAFRIEGPETFYRFVTATATARYVSLAVGVLFFVKDPRHGWPFLVAGACFSLNEALKTLLEARDLLQPLTEVVGSMRQSVVFSVTFATLAALLLATGVGAQRRSPGVLAIDRRSASG